MSDSNSNVYVYGITEQADIETSVAGVGDGGTLYTVDYDPLSALVSDIDTTEPERTDEAVTRHDDVLRTAVEHDEIRTVIPMGFGMAFKNARTLKGVMRGAQRALRKALNDVEGCVELGVKIVAPTDGAVDEDALRLTLDETLGPLSDGQTEDDLFSDRLVANRSYLVEQAARDEFDDAVAALEAEYDGAIVKYTGPWAPYNFVDIHIGAEAST
ncbi:MAG: GvpL/GvpF family gas vesicle protein [Haloglomus sp.]